LLPPALCPRRDLRKVITISVPECGAHWIWKGAEERVNCKVLKIDFAAGLVLAVLFCAAY
jgi:hypothetical protein